MLASGNIQKNTHSGSYCNQYNQRKRARGAGYAMPRTPAKAPGSGGKRQASLTEMFANTPKKRKVNLPLEVAYEVPIYDSFTTKFLETEGTQRDFKHQEADDDDLHTSGSGCCSVALRVSNFQKLFLCGLCVPRNRKAKRGALIPAQAPQRLFFFLINIRAEFGRRVSTPFLGYDIGPYLY